MCAEHCSCVETRLDCPQPSMPFRLATRPQRAPSCTPEPQHSRASQAQSLPEAAQALHSARWQSAEGSAQGAIATAQEVWFQLPSYTQEAYNTRCVRHCHICCYSQDHCTVQCRCDSSIIVKQHRHCLCVMCLIYSRPAHSLSILLSFVSSCQHLALPNSSSPAE